MNFTSRWDSLIIFHCIAVNGRTPSGDILVTLVTKYANRALIRNIAHRPHSLYIEAHLLLRPLLPFTDVNECAEEVASAQIIHVLNDIEKKKTKREKKAVDFPVLETIEISWKWSVGLQSNIAI